MPTPLIRKENPVRRVNTQFLSAERVAEIITRKGIAACLAGVAAYIEYIRSFSLT
jgi:hypothetical protein